MRVHELGHLVFYVRNLERSAHFYRDVLGFPEVRRGKRGIVFSTGRTHHEMLLLEVGEGPTDPPDGGRVGFYHVGLKIGESGEELSQAEAELKAAAVPIVGRADHGETEGLYVRDPDGNEIEVYVDLDPKWQKKQSVVSSQ